MRKTLWVAGGVALAWAVMAAGCEPAAEPTGGDLSPEFTVDPTWPRALPNNWILGPAAGLAVDSRDHIWIVSAPGDLTPQEIGAAQDPPIADCCLPAPPLLVLDSDGRVVDSWDGRGEGYTWPDFPHGVFVDHDENVWIGALRDHHQVLKFTREGEHLLTIGELGVSRGSNDPDRLGIPADIWVNPETNEAFIADGYGNRRVVVFDGDTGEYLRHWGAYGEPPDDDYVHPERGHEAEPSRQFGTVHGLVGSRDGLLYVADRRNNRIQVFGFDGSFVEERIIAPATQASGSAFDVALSPDPEQRYLYLADGTNHVGRVFLRETLEEVGHFGQGGRQAGQFLRPHNLDVDSEGNLYLTEAQTLRIQKFSPGARDLSPESR